MAGIYQADYLTSAEQAGPSFWESQTGVKSQFGNVGLSTRNSILSFNMTTVTMLYIRSPELIQLLN